MVNLRVNLPLPFRKRRYRQSRSNSRCLSEADGNGTNSKIEVPAIWEPVVLSSGKGNPNSLKGMTVATSSEEPSPTGVCTFSDSRKRESFPAVVWAAIYADPRGGSEWVKAVISEELGG